MLKGKTALLWQLTALKLVFSSPEYAHGGGDCEEKHINRKRLQRTKSIINGNLPQLVQSEVNENMDSGFMIKSSVRQTYTFHTKRYSIVKHSGFVKHSSH